MQKKKIQSKTGLTLIETLVAISVLLISVVGPMVIYSRSISDARFASNQITAYYLAQEAVEFVKYRIDTNNNASNPNWLDGLNDCFNAMCTIDVINDLVNACGGNCGGVLFIDSGLYNHLSGTPTVFIRKVNIVDSGNSGNEVTITTTVSWTSVGASKTITVKENIFNWKP